MEIKFSLLLFTVILFTSCRHRREPLLHENGLVVGKQYAPDTRSVAVGMGITSEGQAVTTVHPVGESEKYFVIFKCEHKVVFPINDRDVYVKLKEGDSVIIDFYEIVNNKDEVKDYEFVDANKIIKP